MCQGFRPLQHPCSVLTFPGPHLPSETWAVLGSLQHSWVRGPMSLRSHTAGPERARIWGRLMRLRTEHLESLWPGSDSVSARWVGTLLQPRRSDLVSPLRSLDTSVFCPASLYQHLGGANVGVT